MKRSWRLRRQASPSLDGQRRWNQAYQLLLEWTIANELLSVCVSTSHPLPASLPAGVYQEEDHAHRPVASGLDAATSPPADQ
jgi:hypothetical protein